jgi:excisionase family DNA binding protein
MHERDYLSIAEVADQLGVHPNTIRNKIAAGELPAARLGGRGSSIRIPTEAVRVWLWEDGETCRG